jgi:hypothetical protein
MDYLMSYTPSWLNSNIEWDDGTSDPLISIGFGSPAHCFVICLPAFPPLQDIWYTQVGSFVARSKEAKIVLGFAMVGTEASGYASVGNITFTPAV